MYVCLSGRTHVELVRVSVLGREGWREIYYDLPSVSLDGKQKEPMF